MLFINFYVCLTPKRLLKRNKTIILILNIYKLLIINKQCNNKAPNQRNIANLHNSAKKSTRSGIQYTIDGCPEPSTDRDR